MFADFVRVPRPVNTGNGQQAPDITVNRAVINIIKHHRPTFYICLYGDCTIELRYANTADFDTALRLLEEGNFVERAATCETPQRRQRTTR